MNEADINELQTLINQLQAAFALDPQLGNGEICVRRQPDADQEAEAREEATAMVQLSEEDEDKATSQTRRKVESAFDAEEETASAEPDRDEEETEDSRCRCTYCGLEYDPRGLNGHERHCAANPENMEDDGAETDTNSAGGKGRPPKLSDEDVAEAEKMLENGVAQPKVAEHFDVSRNTITRYVADEFLQGKSKKTVECPYCGEEYVSRGIGPHKAHCDEKPGEDEDAADDPGTTATDTTEEKEIGPARLGKLMAAGTLDEYECHCGETFESETDAQSHADDESHPLGWTGRYTPRDGTGGELRGDRQ